MSNLNPPITFLTEKMSGAKQDFTNRLNLGKLTILQAEMKREGVGEHCKLLFYGVGAANKTSLVARKEILPLSAINVRNLTLHALEMINKANGDVHFKNPSKKLKVLDGEYIPAELTTLYTGANAIGLFEAEFVENLVDFMPVPFVMECPAECTNQANYNRHTQAYHNIVVEDVEVQRAAPQIQEAAAGVGTGQVTEAMLKMMRK
jgi:hypothetical protein